MKLIIVRHAEPDYANDSLTEKGRREATLLADRLGCLKQVKGFYSSPLGRAMETAIPSAKRLGVEPEILPWLQEFRGKILDPETKEERIPWDLKHQFWKANPLLLDENLWTEQPLMTSSTPKVKDVYQETCKGLRELLARYGYTEEQNRMFRCDNNQETTVVLVCHMALAMAIVGYLTRISPFALWHGFCMPPSSVTTLVTEERTKGLVSFRCFQMGDTSHLAVRDEPPSRMAMFQEVFTGTDHTNAT